MSGLQTGAEEWLGDTITKYVDDGTIKVAYRPMAFLDSGLDHRLLLARGRDRGLRVQRGSDVDTWVTFHQLLFENQPEEGGAGLPDSQLADLADQAGADKSAGRIVPRGQDVQRVGQGCDDGPRPRTRSPARPPCASTARMFR